MISISQHHNPHINSTQTPLHYSILQNPHLGHKTHFLTSQLQPQQQPQLQQHNNITYLFKDRQPTRINLFFFSFFEIKSAFAKEIDKMG